MRKLLKHVGDRGKLDIRELREMVVEARREGKVGEEFVYRVCEGVLEDWRGILKGR